MFIDFITSLFHLSRGVFLLFGFCSYLFFGYSVLRMSLGIVQKDREKISFYGSQTDFDMMRTTGLLGSKIWRTLSTVVIPSGFWALYFTEGHFTFGFWIFFILLMLIDFGAFSYMVNARIPDMPNYEYSISELEEAIERVREENKISWWKVFWQSFFISFFVLIVAMIREFFVKST